MSNLWSSVGWGLPGRCMCVAWSVTYIHTSLQDPPSAPSCTQWQWFLYWPFGHFRTPISIASVEVMGHNFITRWTRPHTSQEKEINKILETFFRHRLTQSHVTLITQQPTLCRYVYNYIHTTEINDLRRGVHIRWHISSGKKEEIVAEGSEEVMEEEEEDGELRVRVSLGQRSGREGKSLWWSWQLGRPLSAVSPPPASRPAGGSSTCCTSHTWSKQKGKKLKVMLTFWPFWPHAHTFTSLLMYLARYTSSF